MKYSHLILSTIIILLFTACSVKAPDPVKIETTKKEINYTKEIKPILDNRCVTCHSCYNSPCQAKFSSFEGVDRGGSKLKVYDATRLRAVDPTRLFIDAKSTKQWHEEKGFYSLTQNLAKDKNYNDSVMIHMLNNKMKNPEIVGVYDPESEKLMCPKNAKEMGKYFDKKPNHGMPYGFPALKKDEYTKLAQWIHKGANGPSVKDDKLSKTPSKAAAKKIKKWEKFLNTNDAKHAVTARYIYEHLYLAHLNFKAAPKEFYEIIRSTTAYPQEIDEIPTLRPFDDPKTDKFYYRLRKIHSTIVHKTHMVVKLDDKKLKRFNKLFIETKWAEKPHLIDYEVKTSANPFVAFFQIPVKSRYQFLLDHSNYIVMTFIKGPVCRGQMALNVIHDHFWIMFQDPEYDLAVQQPGFLLNQANNLSLPIESNEQSIFKAFSDDYLDKYEAYFQEKQKLYDLNYPKGLGIESIWKGESKEDAPILTIYRHYNSGSVHKGVLGELPKTAWVIDYAQLERIYYALVAGYDVFGNVSHQTNIRRYMDFLRIEGELNFISYMPQKNRLDIFKSWYVNDRDVESLEIFNLMKRDTKVNYKTQYPKSEFIEQIVNNQILKSTNIKFDSINYYKTGETPPLMPKQFLSKVDVKNGARSLTAPGTNFIKYASDRGINNILVRIKMPDNKDFVVTLVINRWHDNVTSLFREKKRLNASKDTIDFLPGSIGSYPNIFAEVTYNDLPDFFDLIKNFEYTDEYTNKFKNYFVSRSDKTFWDVYDWFQDELNKSQPIEAGLYDLNRYFRRAW